MNIIFTKENACLKMKGEKLKYAWKNRKKIWDGLWFTLFPTDYTELIASKRLLVCLDCSDIDLVGDKCFVNGTQPCCGVCSCKLAWKTRALSEECPLGKWKAKMTEKEEDEFRKKTGIENE